MKHLKRIFCLALVFALALGVGVFARADDLQNPNRPVIYRQPYRDFVPPLIAGKSFTLEVEAYLPAASNGSLSYAWYDFDWKPDSDAEPVATGAKLEIKTTKKMFGEKAFMMGAVLKYCVVVTNTFYDAEGDEQTISVKSDPVSFMMISDPLFMFGAYWKSSYDFFGLVPVIITSPFHLPLAVVWAFMLGPMLYLIASMNDRLTLKYS